MVVCMAYVLGRMTFLLNKGDAVRAGVCLYAKACVIPICPNKESLHLSAREMSAVKLFCVRCQERRCFIVETGKMDGNSLDIG